MGYNAPRECATMNKPGEQQDASDSFRRAHRTKCGTTCRGGTRRRAVARRSGRGDGEDARHHAADLPTARNESGAFGREYPGVDVYRQGRERNEVASDEGG